MEHDQHFLINEKIIETSIEDVNNDDIVLEIGPGQGILTKKLAVKAKKVIAVEIDKELEKYLCNLPKNVQIIYANILEKIDDLHFDKIIANIPYSISEPLLKKLIKTNFELAILLVGEKFYKLLNGKDKLNVVSKIFFNVEKIIDVPKEDFSPKPKVNSVLIKITKRTEELNGNEKIIKEILLQDDKKLKNALIYSFVRAEDLTKKQAKEKINKMKIPKLTLEKNVNQLSNIQFNKLVKSIVA
ncbi:hypothetical protein J4438_02060 [Candidatus Woesearchaeota archaeon]|nr:hypothetical protein [Candidatus Woesearchaeota archaeon]